MATFLAAYIVVWLGVAAFVARMGIKQRHLQQAIDELSDAVERSSRFETTSEQRQALPTRSRAA